MKVNIGPYIHWYSTDELENRWLAWNHGVSRWEGVDEKDYTALDKTVIAILDGWQFVLKHTINRIQNMRKRKIKVRIDSYDLWGMDDTLALIIAPMLRKLKDAKHGSPCVSDDDVPDHLKTPAGSDEYNDPMVHEKWDWVVDEMIWAFEQLEKGTLTGVEWDEQFHSGVHDTVFIPVDEDGNTVEKDDAKFFRMEKTEKDTHVFDSVGYMAHYTRMKNGFRLFGVYYQGLWD